MRSAGAVRLGEQTPRVAHFPRYRSSAGEEFLDLAGSAGLVADPWQRFVVGHGLGERADGRLAAMLVGCWVPRQTGKGGVGEILELGWLFLTKEPLIMHSAHEYKTSQEGFLRIKTRIESTPDLDRRVNRYWQANGEQGIELTKKHGGSRLRFIARSRTSGRGFTGTKNLADEAQELIEIQMAAVLPTMAAMDDPQTWFFGTPPVDGTRWCYRLRARGLAKDPAVAWFDWGADLDLSKPEDRARMADRELWYRCNPALGTRIREEFVAGVEFPSLGDLFAAERLGVWPPAADGGGDISSEAWAALADAASKRDRARGVAFAVDMNPKRTHTSILAWGRRVDGRGHAEVVEYRPGSAWVAGRCAELRDRHDPYAWALDPKGPAGSLVPDLAEVGITVAEDPKRPHRGHLAIPTLAQAAAACGQLLDEISEKAFRHIDQPPLNAAAEGARMRSVGEAQLFGRRVSSVDISPLVALNLARWAYETWDSAADDYDLLDSIG